MKTRKLSSENLISLPVKRHSQLRPCVVTQHKYSKLGKGVPVKGCERVRKGGAVSVGNMKLSLLFVFILLLQKLISNNVLDI